MGGASKRKRREEGLALWSVRRPQADVDESIHLPSLQRQMFHMVFGYSFAQLLPVPILSQSLTV